MPSRKYLVCLAIGLSLFFYVSAALVLMNGLDGTFAEKTYRALRDHIITFHKNTFETRDIAKRLIENYYAGKLTKNDLEANFKPNWIYSIQTIENENIVSMTSLKALPAMPRELMNKDNYTFIKKLENPALHYYHTISLKNPQGMMKAHIITYSIRATALRGLRNVFPFDFTVYNMDEKQELSLIQSTLDNDKRSWLLENIKAHRKQIFPTGPLFSHQSLGDFEWMFENGEKVLVVPFVINYADDFKQVIFYTIPLLYDESGTIRHKLKVLTLFFLLSAIITGLSYYLIRRRRAS